MKLFETMRIDHGTIPRIHYHTRRISQSSSQLNFKFDNVQWHEQINDILSKYHDGVYRLKMILNSDGELTYEIGDVPKKSHFTARLVPAQQTAQHYVINKTTHREQLSHDHATDLILLYDDNHKILEFDIGNIMIQEHDTCYTPLYEGDFLKGCMRQYLLDQHKLYEKNYDKEELIHKVRHGDAQIYLINSLREVAEVKLYL